MTSQAYYPPVLPITLYHYWRSSSSYRVRLALAYKGLAYETVPVNLLKDEQKGDAHLRRNPMGQVPALTIGDHTVVESVAILELLDDLHPEPALYPRDPFDRANVRALVEIVNSGTQPMHNLAVLARVSADGATKAAWSRHFVTRGLTAFDTMRARLEAERVAAHGEAAAGRYVFGDTPTAADIALVPQLYGARRFGVDLAAFPRLLEVEALVTQDPRFASAAPERQSDAVA